ncbi:hypothetical protein [uncultured Gammaproteobacteria bacterium]|nr:hypothetical protein [uncultured Gammaproteobacteria bacterium]
MSQNPQRSSKLLSVNSHLSYQIHPYQSIQKLIITQRQVSVMVCNAITVKKLQYLGVFEWIVYYITVSIVTLCVIWGLNAWIGTKESAYPWVINASIHMNKETVEFK